MMRSLTYRQRLFVDYYLGDSSGSAADAARRVGYRRPEKLGPRLAKEDRIRAAINAHLATAPIAANEVLARVADVASSDLLDFIEVDEHAGCKADLELANRLGLGHLLKRLRTRKDGTQDVELEPKLPALVKLGEHLKLWKGDAQPQVTLVDVAKRLRARYEQLQRDGRCDEPAEDLPEPTAPVQ